MKHFPRNIDMSDFRLVKLEPTTANAERLLAAMNENREFLAEFLEWVDGYTTTEKALANIEKSYGDDKCAYFIMVADDIVGKIGFVDSDDNMGEISYWLAHGFNGRGIMTRALNKLTEMGFADMGLKRIQLTIDAKNIPSAAVALRCGYECEGVLRKYFVLRGVPRDMKMFSKVAV
jgi:ribosomal-protein-serine acetyltransferase